jgi:drug/metabolite transporter (DMT)-like permease
MTMTLAMFAAMMVAVRELAHVMSIFEILAFRSLVALMILLPVAARLGRAGFATGRLRLHVVRNVVHFTAQYGWIMGIALLPLAEVTALEFTTPAWAALLCALFLGERICGHRAVAVTMGLAGVLIILRPGIEVIHPGALIVLASAICYAASNVMVKALTRTDRAFVIVFHMQIVQLPLGLIPALFDWTSPGWAEAPWIILVGVTAIGAHYGIARAFALVDASVILPVDFLRLPFMALIGGAVYGEALDGWVLAGAAVMFAGNYHSVRREARR